MKKNKYKMTGIIGFPLKQTMSPLLHNYWIASNNIDSYYVPIENNKLKDIVKSIRLLKFKGLNVTIPYKKEVMKYLDYTDEVSKKLKAVNTIKNVDGYLEGYNTDIFGFEEGLKKIKNWNKKKTALVIGAGGAAEAIAYTLEKKIDTVFIMNRTIKKAKKIAEKYKNVTEVKWLDYNIINNSDIVVNTTSLGMKGYKKLPLTLEQVNTSTIVYDIVYNPLITPLIREAIQRNLTHITGLEMFIGQAKKSFKIWFGKEPKVDDRIIKKLKTFIQKK